MKFFQAIGFIIVLYSCSSEPVVVSEHMKLELGPSALKKIIAKRDSAIQVKHLYSYKNDYVKGVLIHNSDTHQVRARLKGDHLDHLKGNKWSFRIKSKTPILGHKKFSVHDVITRRLQLEWAFHELLKEVGVIGLDYKFIQFSMNDTLSGIYAFESHFKNELLDSNDREYGPILGFDESSHWKGSKYDDLHYLEKDDSIMVHANLKIYNKKWCKKNKAISDAAIQKMELFKNGKGNIKELIDFQKWADYIAVSELMGFFHNLRWHNVKMYYNPKTSLLEPIGYDAGANFDLNYIWFLSDKVELLYHPMLQSKSFMDEFKKSIEKIARAPFLDEFFTKNRAELNYYEKLNQMAYPEYEFQERAFYYSQEKLLRELKKYEDKIN